MRVSPSEKGVVEIVVSGYRCLRKECERSSGFQPREERRLEVLEMWLRQWGKSTFLPGVRLQLKDHKGRRLRPASSLHAVLKTTGIVLAGLFIVVGAGFLYFEVADPLSHFNTSDEPPPVFDSAVQRIALKFDCTCGRCNMSSLAVCSCPVAVGEKKLIEKELNRGTPEGEVIKQVHDRYGGIKERYAHLLEEK